MAGSHQFGESVYGKQYLGTVPNNSEVYLEVEGECRVRFWVSNKRSPLKETQVLTPITTVEGGSTVVRELHRVTHNMKGQAHLFAELEELKIPCRATFHREAEK